MSDVPLAGHDREAAALSAATPRWSSSQAKPRSDVGTILLHWLVAIAMVASLLTGLRISADAPNAIVSKALSPILPQGEIWTVHFVAGLSLMFGLTAYVIYIARSGLAERNAARRIKAVTLPGSSPAARKARWGAVNIALHWFMYGIVAVMTATGIALYLGFGGWIAAIHAACALISLAYIFVHITTHFLYGGWNQILRLFKPSRLVGNAAQRRPLLAATLVSLPVIVGLAYADVASRSRLAIEPVATSPDLSLRLSDPAWKTARPVFVRTMQGSNFGGTGETTIEIRALHDTENVYFAMRWWDPSRSLRRVPMIKRADGWHLLDTAADRADVVDYYEDKLAVIFSDSDAFGSGGSTHMGPRPLADRPAPLNERGYHYTTDGSYIDMWQWKASRGGMLGFVENMHIGPPTEPTPAEIAVKGRYQAGYWGDPGGTMYRYNFSFEGPGGYRGVVTPLRLPKDWRATVAGLGAFDPNPDAGVAAGSKWWMFEAADTVPYSAELDATVPVGTVMPGVLITGEYTGGRGGISSSADWADNHWTLVAKRRLKTGSKYDKDFTPGSRYYLWVSAFDHTQTRHTRHVRPVEVVFR
ncbi:ethylbenzene dehydrogenase-related protein [uncultured Enterovirga sp.]|uniref:ethylbenzene dehydrogenase-related protein n=1 Tax=uncultured Enterovirga sp. TaxID=2026352 RepID=UPI0035CAEEFF